MHEALTTGHIAGASTGARRVIPPPTGTLEEPPRRVAVGGHVSRGVALGSTFGPRFGAVRAVHSDALVIAHEYDRDCRRV